jgi:hypothetical protein
MERRWTTQITKQGKMYQKRKQKMWICRSCSWGSNPRQATPCICECGDTPKLKSHKTRGLRAPPHRRVLTPKLEKLQQLFKLHLFHGTCDSSVTHPTNLHHSNTMLRQTQNLLLTVLVNNKFRVGCVTNLLTIHQP